MQGYYPWSSPCSNCSGIRVHTIRLCLHLAFAVRVGPVGAGVAQQIASAGAAQKMLGGVSGSDIVHTLSVSTHFQVSKHFTVFPSWLHHGRHSTMSACCTAMSEIGKQTSRNPTNCRRRNAPILEPDPIAQRDQINGLAPLDQTNEAQNGSILSDCSRSGV